MKQNLRLLLLTLLCAVVTGAWGQTTVAEGTFNGKNGEYTTGWTTTGTGVSRTDCIVIGAGENITSPALNLSGYTKVKILFKGRRFGSLTGSKATVDASIGSESMGTIDITSGSVGDVPGDIEFEPTSDMTQVQLVFTCTNATSAGSTHGAGINTITIQGFNGTETKAPVFSPEPGAVVAGTTITCTTETEGATIYYTTDGSTPDEDSDEFPAAGVEIDEATTFKAIAIDAAGNSSEVTTAAYTIKVTALTTVSNKTWVFGADQYNADYTENNIVDNMEVCAGVTKSKKNSGYEVEIDGTKPTTKLQVGIDKWLHVKVAAGSRVTFYVSSSGGSARTVNITTDAEGTNILNTLTIEAGSDNYKPYYYDYSGTSETDIYFQVVKGGQCHVVGAKVAPMPDVAAPTFNPEGGEYTEAKTVTISCATENVDIFYTLDGSDPTDESNLYSEPITISETTTLKAIAYNADGESSEVTSATYTITAAATVDNIAEFKALGDGKVATLTLTNAQVLFASGNNIVVADASGGILFFKTNLGYSQWNVLNGTIKAKYTLYNGIPELTAVEESNITVTAGEEPEPTEFAAANATEANICRYYTKMSEVKLAGSNKSFTATFPDGSTFAVYNQLGITLTTPTAGTAYNVYGVLGRYNNNFQFWPIADFEVAETKADPELAFDPTTVELNVGETANVTFSNPNDLDVEFTNEDETVATYANGVVTALKAGTTTITATSAETEEYKAGEAVLTITVTEGSATDEGFFVKVTKDADLTSGTYLIVYEDGNLAFDGGLETLDASGNSIEVTISDNKIPRTQTTDAATFTIDVDEGTILSKSGFYIGKTADSNGMNVTDDEEKAYTNTISIDADGNANIKGSGGAYLRYNASSGQERFRYFKSGSYTSQKVIQLYKLVEPEATSIMVDITPVGYATLYYSDKSLIIPEGIVAKRYGLNSDNALVEITPALEAGETIPSDNAVVLEATASIEETTTFEFVIDNSETISMDSEWANNLLRGSDEPTMTDEIVEGDNLYYVLSTDKNGENVGFYWGAKKGAAFENGAHKAFLAIPKSSGVNVSAFVFDDLTGIRNITSDNTEDAEGVYTLSGMRIDSKQLPKGIYIVNGKKMVIK